MTDPRVPHDPEPREGRGIGYMLVAVALFATMDACAKVLVADIPVMEILFFRGLVGAVASVPLVALEGGLDSLRTARLHAHLGRSLLFIGALAAFYVAISLVPLADAYAIVFTAPLFVTALSVPLLGERVGIRRWTAVAVGFLGMLFIVRPGGELHPLGAGFALASSLLYSIGLVGIRRLTRTETDAAIVTYFTLSCLAVSGAFMPWQWVTPSPRDLGLLLLAGLLGATGSVFITKAFRAAPASVVAPFDYTYMVWGLAYGYWLFGDAPQAFVLVGAAIIVASGIYVFRREAGGKRRASFRV